MLAQEENELLTRVGPGTRAGKLLRRYWQPVALVEELPKGGSPLNVEILGERLVLFRDDRDRLGLLDLHCSHRGADLSYGRLEDGGLRCIYHGWLYDVCGKVLDMPGEADGGEKIRDSIQHLAYPCQEAGGVIFAYLGPEPKPLLPRYEFLSVPQEQRSVTKVFQNCNYLQGNEGNIDPVHISFLHRIMDRNRPQDEIKRRDIAPTIDIELTNFGLRIYAARKAGPQEQLVRITNFVMPNLAAFNGAMEGQGYSVNWHVPIDDTHHWKYSFIFSRRQALSEGLRGKNRFETTPDYKPLRHKENRYLQDRSSMDVIYTGIGRNFMDHDICATEGLGPIQDRTKEHLISSDKAIVASRKLILKSITDIEEGRDPAHVVRDPNANRFTNLIVASEVISASLDRREFAKSKEAEIRQSSEAR
jgi:phenylpropionate dioxygenase-like ring-hydroxylating dioxygenase large terminal subunit